MKSKWVLGLGFKVIHGSDGYLDFGESGIPSNLRGPDSTALGLGVYRLHPRRSTALGLTLMAGYQIKGNKNVLKLKAGGQLAYLDQTGVSSVYGEAINPITLEENFYIVNLQYDRYLDFGWVANVAYEYHFSDTILAGVVLDVGFFSEGENFQGVGLYFGVKLVAD